jgi:hypothetical protein
MRKKRRLRMNKSGEEEKRVCMERIGLDMIREIHDKVRSIVMHARWINMYRKTE